MSRLLALWDAKVRDVVTVTLYEKAVPYTGTVVHVFRANIPPKLELVDKFYGLNPQDDERTYRAVCRPIGVDRVVIEYDTDKYLIIPRHPKAGKYVKEFSLMRRP